MTEEMSNEVKDSLLESVSQPTPVKQRPGKWAGLLLILFLGLTTRMGTPKII